jgi:hypothetical protein
MHFPDVHALSMQSMKRRVFSHVHSPLNSQLQSPAIALMNAGNDEFESGMSVPLGNLELRRPDDFKPAAGAEVAAIRTLTKETA